MTLSVFWCFALKNWLETGTRRVDVILSFLWKLILDGFLNSEPLKISALEGLEIAFCKMFNGEKSQRMVGFHHRGVACSIFIQNLHWKI